MDDFDNENFVGMSEGKLRSVGMGALLKLGKSARTERQDHLPRYYFSEPVQLSAVNNNTSTLALSTSEKILSSIISIRLCIR